MNPLTKRITTSHNEPPSLSRQKIRTEATRKKLLDSAEQIFARDGFEAARLEDIASMDFQEQKFAQAKEYYQKIEALDPNDPETYYSLAVIDWMQAYQPDQKARAELGLKPTDELKDKKACTDLQQENAQRVEDGIQNLQKAIQLRPDYDDAMAYLNLLYRQRAEYECDNADARKSDLKTADDWVDKTMATKKAKAEKSGPTGIVTTESAQ